VDEVGKKNRYGGGKSERMCRGVWDEEVKEIFKANLERIKRDEENMQKILRDMDRRIREAMERTEYEGRGKRKKSGWRKENVSN